MLVPVQYQECEYDVFVHNNVFNLHFQRAGLVVKLASLYINMHMSYCYNQTFVIGGNRSAGK